MSTHRYIATSFWDDDWIQSLDPSEKLLYLYLMTNPLTNIAGVYKITNRRISFDTGFNEETIARLMEKFSKGGKAYRAGEYIILPSWPSHQEWEKSEKIKTGIDKLLAELSAEMLIALVFCRYRYPLKVYFDTLSIPYPKDTDNPPTILLYYIKSNINLNSFNTGCADAEASPPGGENSLSPSSFPQKPKKPPLREREPENNMEKVEKAYLKNWDTLYTEKRVKTPDPVVNWNQTRALLKKHFDRLAPEQIIQALNVGMADSFIMSGGYSLGIILSASVLNRLINSGQSGGPAPPSSLKDKKSLRGLDSW